MISSNTQHKLNVLNTICTTKWWATPGGTAHECTKLSKTVAKFSCATVNVAVCYCERGCVLLYTTHKLIFQIRGAASHLQLVFVVVVEI